jgi:transposase
MKKTTQSNNNASTDDGKSQAKEIAELIEENKNLQNILVEKETEIQTLKFKAEQLEHQLQKALMQLYGSKADKAKEPDEPSTFDEPELTPDTSAEELEQADEEITIPEHKRKKPKRKPLPKQLPRREVIHDLPEEEKICKCGELLTHISDEESEQLEFIPAKVEVIVNKRRKYACKACEETIKLALLPKMPIPKSIATPSLLASVLIAKYCDHLPLYRQEQIWQRYGVDVPRQTMCNWVIKCAKLLSRIVDVMKANILASNYARADETTVQVLEEEGRKATDKSYMWIFMTGLKINNNIVFEYHATRGSIAATNFFHGFKGYLQTDAYYGYNTLRRDNDIINLGCMAHCRRNFTDITKTAKKAGKAHEAVKYIRALYKIEEQIKDWSFDERYRYRQEHAKPILEKFKTWLDQSIEHVPPKSPIGEAINYPLNRWPELIRYLDHGMLEIDNNWAENQIRPFAIGRRNWLFMGNATGAWASSIIYSLVITAKANGLDPWKYLVDVLNKAPYCEMDADFAKLVPVPGYFDNS